MGDDTDDESKTVTIPLQRHEREKLTEYIDVGEVAESRRDDVAYGLQSIEGTWDGTASATMKEWFTLSMEMRSHDEDGLRAPNVGRRIARRVKNAVENGGVLTDAKHTSRVGDEGGVLT